ncbi:MAG: zf-HC2 domain-containing protein [Ignavibacteria bacterium]|nr:zf-HC2 domain-containing protein [Ignavibacteria bacterium]
MDCKEFQEYISPYVDNQIDSVKKNEIEEHLKICSSCFFDFKVESLAKRIVTFRFQKATCPEAIRNQIIFNLASQRSFSSKVINYIKVLFANKTIRYAIAFGVLLIGFLIFYNPFENQKEKYYYELAKIVYQNCKEIRNHNFPEKTIFASSHDVVMNFISSNGIKNPKMPKTQWSIIAAGIENYQNYQAAHLLFKCENDTIYMMECEMDKISHSGYLNFVKEIHKDLAKKKFFKVDHEGCSIILRLENGVLMAFAMSSDNKHSMNELIASLD